MDKFCSVSSLFCGQFNEVLCIFSKVQRPNSMAILRNLWVRCIQWICNLTAALSCQELFRNIGESKIENLWNFRGFDRSRTIFSLRRPWKDSDNFFSNTDQIFLVYQCHKHFSMHWVHILDCKDFCFKFFFQKIPHSLVFGRWSCENVYLHFLIVLPVLPCKLKP